MSGIDFLSIKGHDISYWDDCVNERSAFGSGVLGTLASESSLDREKDTYVVDIDFS